jgi:hypothetical protein
MRKVILVLAPEVLDVAAMVNWAFAVGTPKAQQIFNLIVGMIINDLATLESLECEAELLLAQVSLA